MWTDDTPVTVLGGKQPGSSTGRFWVYIGDAEHPYSVYDFTMSRARDGPAAFLKDYRGFLQADAYGGYDGIFLGSDGGIVEVACWAHARRKFFDARSNAPREANQVLEWIRQLYDIEDRARDFTPVERQVLRQLESVPILDRIENVFGRTVTADLAQVGVGEGDDLRTEPVGGVAAIRERRTIPAFPVPTGGGLSHPNARSAPTLVVSRPAQRSLAITACRFAESPKRPICLEGSDGFVSSSRRFDSYRLERPRCRARFALAED